APATQDLSSRVLLCDRHDAENQGTANVLLDNADGALTGLAFDPEASGDRLALDFGYVTSAGTEVSAGAPVWVAAVELTAGTGTGYVELICHDAWSLLAAWQPRRLYLWPAGSNTILQIIQWLLARNGIPLVSPPSPSAQLLRTPAYAIQPATSGAHALHALLDQVPETLHFTAQGAVLRTPLAGETPVYAYTPSAHPVLSYRVHTGAQSLNDVLVFGRSQPTSTAPTLLAEAIDAPDGLRVAGHPFPVTDMQVSVAEAANRAAITLRKAQYIQDAGEIATVPNVGLELWDLVALTVGDPGGWINAPARVRALHTRYDRLTDGGVYTQSVGLMYP
ncbi:MAG TPA: hypothetical protein VFA70_13320, partial [Dehalococcoidia bacterium]|nr:hypothetical protein [Dehalococcoidia bacterium]